jgi:hypothetical protein
MDGVKDADETDVDCGGSCGATCTDTNPQQHCQVAGDCKSGVCTGGLCIPPTCSDGVVNGNETDKDCGGAGYNGNPPCPKCADKLHCAANSDCVNGLCFGTNPGTCVSCSDGAKDGNETGVDCGGPECDALGKTCGNGQGCVTGGDCASGSCQGNVCVLGPNGAPCSAGSACQSGNCASGVCCDTPCTGVCQACMFAFTGQATGTCAPMFVGTPAPSGQCPAAPPCGNTGNCAAGGTCEQAAASVACSGSSCVNGMLTTVTSCDGSGHCAAGSVVSACAGGLVCADATSCKSQCGADSDCISTNACDAISMMCVSSQCIDHRQDGAETDVDCGGGGCLPCGLGLKCLVDIDCASNACDGITQTCVNSQCIDHRQDGAETDIDCGGLTCLPCGLGLKCLVDSDCSSNACDANTFLCVASQCADHRQDGTETDIDCGGAGSCPPCVTGLKCLADSDCTSNACDALSLTCVNGQCNDHRKDGLETDVDCGGNVCLACARGMSCNTNFDCASAFCSGITHVCL